jgi:hypothetical protein
VTCCSITVIYALISCYVFIWSQVSYTVKVKVEFSVVYFLVSLTMLSQRHRLYSVQWGDNCKWWTEKDILYQGQTCVLYLCH